MQRRGIARNMGIERGYMYNGIVQLIDSTNSSRFEFQK